ncbi:Hypothetical protein PHPALM_15397 [Phytophthora palmivora]|uniref:Reverse transcriptase n=1 Tax=Phytophthora palmivora TaxID=4796 RepID=A0A2P4XSC4_9STRA|nr:Hypothetical protein PHPALM_15397 [Phytophthora palmivora]
MTEEGVESFCKSELELRLDRSLYGMKQGGRLWYQHMHRNC